MKTRAYRFLNPSQKLVALGIVALAIPILPIKSYVLHLLVISCIYSMLALSLNLVMGVTGQLSLGHAALYCVGAYTAGLLALNNGLNILVTIPAAAVVTAAVAFVIAYPTLKLKGIYFGMVTLGLNEIVRFVLLNAEFTRGPNGLPGITPAAVGGVMFDSPRLAYYLTVAFLFFEIVIMERLMNSRQGDAMVAVREDELAAESLGINTTTIKIAAFVISSVFAGIAGAFYAHYVGYINPNQFSSGFSIAVLSMCIIGGMGSVPGAILGAVVYVLLPEFLRFADLWRLFIYGTTLVAIMVFRPQGLIGQWATFRELAGLSSWSKSRTADPSAVVAPITHDTHGKTDPLLEVSGATVRFGGLVAVNEVDLGISLGQITSLIGPNGAGKTTMFNAVTGMNRLSSGRVTFESIDLTGTPPFERCKAGIARTFQNIRLFGNLSVLHNVVVARHVRTRAGLLPAVLSLPSAMHERNASIAKASALLAMVGLLDKADVLAKHLPYGEQRRLEVARALATEPRLLLLDEPVAGMNPQETGDAMNLIREINSFGVTTLLVEHDMKVVMGISDKVAVLNYGRLLARGTPSEVRTNREVIDAYLGTDDEEESAREAAPNA